MCVCALCVCALVCVLCLWVYCSGVVCFVASSCVESLRRKYPVTHLCASDSQTPFKATFVGETQVESVAGLQRVRGVRVGVIVFEVSGVSGDVRTNLPRKRKNVTIKMQYNRQNPHRK